jgi:hypothetical protein
MQSYVQQQQHTTASAPTAPFASWSLPSGLNPKP